MRSGSGSKRSRRSCASNRCLAASEAGVTRFLPSPWMDVPALRALALAVVELVEERRQVGDDVLHVHFDAMHEHPALRAIPLESVVDVEGPDFLHHHADGSGATLRRMAQVTRDQQDLAFPDRDVARLA